MSALFIGFLLVVFSAAALGVALFGRRPVPQPATVDGSTPRAETAVAEMGPSLFRSGQLTVARVPGVDSPLLIQPPREPGHLDQGQVRVPVTLRIRSAILLALATLGTAVLVGAVLSIVVVGAVLLLG
jgi:hypothetical protein